MSVIRLPTAASEPVRNPAVYDTAPRCMCEARGYLAAVRGALRMRPDLRCAIVAGANAPAPAASVDPWDVLAAVEKGRAA